MKLQTALKIEEYIDVAGIDYNSSLVFMGSCFTDNIGKKMSHHKFDILINPLGISYNPLSLDKHIQYLNGKGGLNKDTFFKSEKGYVHFDFHSDLSHKDPTESLRLIQARIDIGRKAIKNASHVFISYGTAIVYEKKEDKSECGTAKNNQGTTATKVVNNCHKQYYKNFENRILTLNEIEQGIRTSISTLRDLNEKLKIIFTLSPVRHIKNGLVNDRRSKSLLHVAIHNQVELNHNCFYFPSYEIIVDELRDYRFYKEDMFHPSYQAVEYIWNKFGESFFNQKTKEEVKVINKIVQQLNHKPLYKDTESYKTFRKSLLKTLEEKSKQGFSFGQEIAGIKSEYNFEDPNGVSGPE